MRVHAGAHMLAHLALHVDGLEHADPPAIAGAAAALAPFGFIDRVALREAEIGEPRVLVEIRPAQTAALLAAFT